MYKEGIKWLISERPFCLGRKTGEWCSFFWFCFVDFGVGVVCLCVYFPEHLRVILHSYSSRREGLRKKVISGYQVDTPPDPSSRYCPCCTVLQGCPLPPWLLTWHPTLYKIMERRTGMQSRGICMIFHCPTPLAVCKTNTVTCFGVVVSLQPFLYLIKKLLEKSLWIHYEHNVLYW